MAGKKNIVTTGLGLASEYEEQKALVQWLELKGILFYHIPNGGLRNIREAAKFKRLGVKAGVPDICICKARKGYHGLYIELKRIKNSSISPHQKLWLDNLNAEGYLATIANGCLEAIVILNNYLS